MHYMNACLKRCVFNLDLNRESVSEPRTLSGWLFQSLGAKYEKALPPLVDFAILGTAKSPEFCDLRERVGLQHDSVRESQSPQSLQSSAPTFTRSQSPAF